MRACADPNREGRWITEDFIEAYVRLFDLGWAHSVEVYADDVLVGGLYGVRIGGCSPARRCSITRPTRRRSRWSNSSTGSARPTLELLDVQWATPHLASLGVIEIPRVDYLRALAEATAGVDIDGPIPVEND